MLQLIQTHVRILLVLTVLGFVTYGSSFINVFVWDDEQFIYKNAYVQNFAIGEIFSSNTIAGAGESSNYYRPLTTLSFAIDHAIWGLQPVGFHLTNTLLHVLTGLLLYLYLRQLRLSNPASFAIAVLFLVHPVQTEAVTYMNSRGDSLFAFFLLLGLVCYVTVIPKLEHINWANTRSLLPVISLGFLAWFCYILSTLSKEIGLAGIGLFGLSFVYTRWLQYDRPGKIWRFIQSFIWKNHGWFILYLQVPVTIGYLILRSTVLNFTGNLNQYAGTEYGSSLLIRMLTFSKIWLEYIWLLLWPHPLYMDRQPAVIGTWLNPYPWLALVVLAGFMLIGWVSWKRCHNPMLLFGLAWFIGMLVPVSGIIGINGMMYEHWLYVPQIGFWLMLLGLGQVLTCSNYAKFIIDAFNRKAFIIAGYSMRIKYILFVVIILILIGLTVRQNYYWSTPIRLYNHLLKYTETARIHNNLAMAYSEAQALDQAILHYQRSIELDPYYPQTYHNLANTYDEMGQTERAASYYRQALEVMPSFYWSRSNLVILLMKQDKYPEALEHVRYLKQQFPGEITFIQQEAIILESMSDSTTQ